jgi:hypothetical protein
MTTLVQWQERIQKRRDQYAETHQSALHAAVDRFAEDAMTPSDRPMAFVTGANKGIGFEVAPAIAKADYVVLLGARNPPSRRSWVAL